VSTFFSSQRNNKLYFILNERIAFYEQASSHTSRLKAFSCKSFLYIDHNHVSSHLYFLADSVTLPLSGSNCDSCALQADI